MAEFKDITLGISLTEKFLNMDPYYVEPFAEEILDGKCKEFLPDDVLQAAIEAKLPLVIEFFICRKNPTEDQTKAIIDSKLVSHSQMAYIVHGKKRRADPTKWAPQGE